MKRCKRRSDFKEYRYFIFGVDDSSEIIDIGYYDLPNGYFVLVDNDVPVIRCWMPVEEFEEKYVVDGGVVDPVEELKKCRYKYNDTNIYNYLVYGENPERDKLLLIDAVFPFGTYVVFKNDGPEGCFPEHFKHLFDLLDDAHISQSSMEVKVNDGEGPRFCICRNDHSVIHEYFIYGVDATPEWAKLRIRKTTFSKFKKGDIVVTRGDNGIVFPMDEEGFRQNLEDCSRDGVVEIINEDVVPPAQPGVIVHDMKKCVRKSDTGIDAEIFEYFVYGIDPETYTTNFDSVAGDHKVETGDFVVIKYGIAKFYRPYVFVDMFDRVNGVGSVVSSSENKEEVPDYMMTRMCSDKDGNVFSFFVYGVDDSHKWFFRNNIVNDINQGDYVVRDFVYHPSCEFSVYGVDISFMSRYSEVFGAQEIVDSPEKIRKAQKRLCVEKNGPNVVEKVNEITGEEKYKQEIEESKKVGTCKSKLYDDGKVFEYFYFTRNMEVFPEWFDTKKFVLESLIEYPYVVYGPGHPDDIMIVCIYDLRTFTNNFIIAKDYFWTNKDSEGLELRNHEWGSVKSTINVPDEKADYISPEYIQDYNEEEGYTEISFKSKICIDKKTGDEFFYFKKEDEIPEWFKLSGSNLKHYQDCIIYYGWLDFRSLNERKFNIFFKEKNIEEVTIRLPLLEEKVDEKDNDLTYLGESTEAINWLYSMDQAVKNYLLDKYIKKSTYGEISILNIYKEEMGL